MLKQSTLKLALPSWLLFLLLLLTHGHAFAQGTQAVISGSAVDKSGNSIPNTTIRVRNTSTGFSTTTVTNERGNFEIKQLPLGGPYTVTATNLENGEGSVTGVMLNQGDVARVKIEMISNDNVIDAVEVTGTSLKNS